MILHVIKAKYLEDYRVEVSFNDGNTGTVDLSQSLTGPVFDPLKDIKIFSKLKVDNEPDTIVWPNGADFAPEYLYFQAFKEAPELQNKFKKWGYHLTPMPGAGTTKDENGLAPLERLFDKDAS